MFLRLYVIASVLSQSVACTLTDRLSVVRDTDEDGLTTAELLGNAALAVAALAIIWTALRAVGVDVVDYIRAQMGL